MKAFILCCFVPLFLCQHLTNMRRLSFSFLLVLCAAAVTVSAAKTLDEDCPTLDDSDNLSQTHLVQRLTHGCRYDRLERPITYSEAGVRLPIDVYVRAYVYFMANLEAHDLQFKMHALLQLRYVDPRLTFRRVAPKRMQPILGEKKLRDTLWIPHIFLANERDSSILGTNEKDILTSISPDGTVIISNRVRATLYCWMNLQKFPFDKQHCSTVLESWMYNTSELVLHWESKRPIAFDPALHLTEYIIDRVWSNETVINADLNDLRHGAFAGNYSSLSFTVHLTREVGFYLMDYFLPSMLIVGISWVSFWLQADQAPPRITLGTSTMLTFITLASAQGKTLPKVSYIKVSEVWFLGCTLFIFGSLLEFAFVNTIWRRKRNIDVKKMNSKHILKSTLSPHLSRRSSRTPRPRSSSFSVMGGSIEAAGMPRFNNYLTVHNIPITTISEDEDAASAAAASDTEAGKAAKTTFSTTSTRLMSARTTAKQFDLNFQAQPRVRIDLATCMERGQLRRNSSYVSRINSNFLASDTNSIHSNNNNNNDATNSSEDLTEEDNLDFQFGRDGFTTLTPQQISMWIDRKSRCVFPVAFLVFNAFFWTFVYFL